MAYICLNIVWSSVRTSSTSQTTWDLVLHTSLILTHGLLSGLNSELPHHQRLVWWSLKSWLYLATLTMSALCLVQVLWDFVPVSEGTALPGFLGCQFLNHFHLQSYTSLCCSPKDWPYGKSSMEKEVKLADHYTRKGNITRLRIFLIVLLQLIFLWENLPLQWGALWSILTFLYSSSPANDTISIV